MRRAPAPRRRRAAGAALIAGVVLLVGCGAPYSFEAFPPRLAAALGELEQDRGRVELFYATDRRATGADDPRYHWGVERTLDLKLGRCDVTIPPGHGRGRLESAGLGSPRPERDVRLARIGAPLEREAFVEELRREVAESPRRATFLFVHGFYVDFHDGARRAAQIAHDVSFEGPALVYSWPTQGGLLSYLVDASNVEWSEPYLVELLALLVDESGATSVNLMAHSMGARLLARGLREFMQARKAPAEPPFDQVILAAADIDAEIFARDYARYVAGAARRLTIYFSSADWALGGSTWMHKYDRLGRAGLTRMHPRLRDRIDLIDASEVDRGIFGHIYYGESPRLLDDLAQLLSGSPAGERRLQQDGVVYRLDGEPVVISDKP